MHVAWAQIADPAAYAQRVLAHEASDIPAELITGRDWIQQHMNLSELQVDERMLAAHDTQPLHIARRDGFVERIKAGEPIPPLIALGARLHLVDGYARYRALRHLGIQHAQVLRQH